MVFEVACLIILILREVKWHKRLSKLYQIGRYIGTNEIIDL